MTFPDILNTKVVDCKNELDGVACVCPEAGSVWLFVISVAGKAFFEEFIGKDASLREAIHAFPNFHVDVTFKGFCW